MPTPVRGRLDAKTRLEGHRTAWREYALGRSRQIALASPPPHCDNDSMRSPIHLSAALANQRINVEELETECSSAPMSGESIFKAVAKLQIPEGCAISELRQGSKACRQLPMPQTGYRPENPVRR